MTQAATALAPGWTEPMWLQQPFETEAQHQAFTIFKDMPKRYRSMAEVSRHVDLTKEDVRAIALAHHWGARIAAYDSFVSGSKISLLNERKEDRHAKHLHVLDLSLEVVERELNNLLDRQRQCDAQGRGVTHLKPNELRSLIRDTIKLERLIRGDVTERAEEQYDLSAFTTDDLIKWKELTDKAKATRTRNLDAELDALDDD